MCYLKINKRNFHKENITKFNFWGCNLHQLDLINALKHGTLSKLHPKKLKIIKLTSCHEVMFIMSNLYLKKKSPLTSQNG
jgi:hypothetical protein